MPKHNPERTNSKTMQLFIPAKTLVDEEIQNKNTTQYVLDTTMRKQTKHNGNKTCALLQTNGGKDEPNIVSMRKS
jgi:hypothetical protein